MFFTIGQEGDSEAVYETVATVERVVEISVLLALLGVQLEVRSCARSLAATNNELLKMETNRREDWAPFIATLADTIKELMAAGRGPGGQP